MPACLPASPPVQSCVCPLSGSASGSSPARMPRARRLLPQSRRPAQAEQYSSLSVLYIVQCSVSADDRPSPNTRALAACWLTVGKRLGADQNSDPAQIPHTSRHTYSQRPLPAQLRGTQVFPARRHHRQPQRPKSSPVEALAPTTTARSPNPWMCWRGWGRSRSDPLNKNDSPHPLVKPHPLPKPSPPTNTAPPHHPLTRGGLGILWEGVGQLRDAVVELLLQQGRCVGEHAGPAGAGAATSAAGHAAGACRADQHWSISRASALAALEQLQSCSIQTGTELTDGCVLRTWNFRRAQATHSSKLLQRSLTSTSTTCARPGLRESLKGAAPGR